MYRIPIIVVGAGLSLLFDCYAVSFGLTLDLAKETADVQILNASTTVFQFDSLFAGDCNGDGVDDVIMRGRSGTVVSIIFGQKKVPKIIQLSDDTPPNLMITNIPRTSSVLPQVSVADLNGDHIGDLLIVVEDGLEIFWGRRTWPAHLDMRTHSPDLRIVAKGKQKPGGGATALVTTGDINHDGMVDVLFAHEYGPAPSGEYLPGKEEWQVHSQETAWILWGRKSWPREIDLSRQAADVVITAEEANPGHQRIRPFRIADLDGDGFGDIIAGAWGDLRGVLDPPPGAPWSRAWVIQGSADLPRHVKLELARPTKSPSGSRLGKQKQRPLLLIDAWPSGKFIGGGIAVGDVNGDGKEDLVLTILKKGDGAFSITKEFCLLKGSPDFFSKESTDILARCSMIVGGPSFQIANPIVSPRPLLSDFNGDGRKDLFVLMEGPDLTFKGLLGRDTFSSSVSIDEEADLMVYPPADVSKRRFGYGSSSTIGDINGDGMADLLIGDPLGGIAPEGKVGLGMVHIVLGRDMKEK